MNTKSTIQRFTVLGLLLGLLVISFGCESPTESDELTPVEIEGTVIDQESGDPVEDVVVRIVSLKPEEVQQTDENGQYSFSVTIDTTRELIIIANKEAYTPDTTEVLAVPERNISVPNMRIKPVEGDKTGGLTGPNSIVLAGLSHESIVVKESGAIENAAITFEVQDSTGRPLDLSQVVDVHFVFGARPGGGEELYPLTAKTDANGQATTNLHSGTDAGVVQVAAYIEYEGETIRSRPVQISIHSGLPDQAHFGIGSEVHNMPFTKFGVLNEVTAIVGDKYGNIVSPGTSVYFSTTGGVIEGSALTNTKGQASVELYTNNPFPDHEDYGPGYATVTAQTADENDNTIETTKLVVFSVEPQITNINPMNFNIGNGASQTFTYTVSDVNGNPLTGGTNVTVRAEGGVKLSGDINTQIDDALWPGEGITDFTFTATDTTFLEEPSPVTISIETDGPNGTARRTFSGVTN